MKKILALALIASLCLSACSSASTNSSSYIDSSTASSSSNEGTTSSSSTPEQSSSSSSDASASTSTTEGALTLEEIKAIFSELDAKNNEMMKWVIKDYSKIHIDNVSVHKVDNVTTKLLYDLDGPTPVYGTAIFAKVTEKTLPGFPWSSLDEIKNDILKIHKSIQDTGFWLGWMITKDINDVNCIFYEFDDGLYFRVVAPTDNHRIVNARYTYWDYSITEIIKNKSDEISVIMYEIEDSSWQTRHRRSIIKNDGGNWVISEKKFLP